MQFSPDDGVATAHENEFGRCDHAIGCRRSTHDPLVEESSRVKLHQVTVARDGVGALDHVTFAASHRTEIVVAQLTQYGTPTHQRDRLFILSSTLQVPVLHVPVADRHEVVAILAERHGDDFGADFVRGNLQVGLPIEDVDDVIVL